MYMYVSECVCKCVCAYVIKSSVLGSCRVWDVNEPQRTPEINMKGREKNGT